MASGGAEEEDEGISLDIDDRHMLLHVEQEEIQKRTFTNWINAQLAKRSPPSRVSDLFSDLKDGSVLLDLLEVITGQPLKRQRGHGAFQQRADIETALDFLRKKSIKLVNVNIPDIIDGRPAIILGLIWTIILHCYIEDMARSLSSFHHSPLDTLQSRSSSPASASLVPAGQRSLHRNFGVSAKKALLTWAKDQCQRVGCPVSVEDFKSSWRSGEVFLAILCSLRPQLVDLSKVQSRSPLENLEEAFELAERELHIPRLLEPQDVDVVDPDEKSIMTCVAQFLQFSIDCTTPDAHLQLMFQEPLLVPALVKNDNGPTSQSSLPSLKKLIGVTKEKKGHKNRQPSPLKVAGEGHTEAKKAKSRLEKTRVRLHERIQQATKLFSNKEISEAEAKRKQKALKILQPAVLEDFLAAVEDFGAFCSEPQLQDLMLLSDSVRKQWEDVRMEMAAYIPMLWSKIREGEQPLPLSSNMYTNSRATDLTNHDDWHQQQVFTEEALCSEECFRSVQELEGSSSFTTEQMTQATGAEQTTNWATLLSGDTPLRATGTTIATQPRNKLLINKPPVNCPQQDHSQHVPHDMVLLQAHDVPAEEGVSSRPVQHHARREQDSLLEDKELPLKACVQHVSRSEQQHQIQVDDSVWTRHQRKWAGITGKTIPQQKRHPIGQEVEQSVKCVAGTTDLMESVNDKIRLITENLNKIITKPVNISSLTLTEPTVFADLKDISDRLQAEMEQLLEQTYIKPEAISPHSDTLYSSVHPVKQHLEQVTSALQALDLFLATMREVKAETSKVFMDQDDNKCQNATEWKVEIQQRFQTALEQSESIDSALNAVGLRLTMNDTNVTCQDVVTLLFKHVEEEITQAKNIEIIVEEQQVQENEEVKQKITKEHLIDGEKEEKTGCLEVIKDVKMKEQHKAQRVKEEAVKTSDQKRRRRTSQKKKKGGCKEKEESLDQRRVALMGTLKELGTAAEELGLQEATLPGLQQRTQALMRLESCLRGLQSELEHIREVSQLQNPDVSVNTEVEDLWEVTTKVISERLDQCRLLKELLKRFQRIHGDVGETLQRAENTLRAQASYKGRENLQRLQTKVGETKTELNILGDRIEELRSVCRQLYSHLHQIPQCTNIPFESVADTIMDQWLDISERAESHVENLHLALSLWDGALKLGVEVESWAINKLAAFSHSPTFQTEQDIKALQDEIEAQEESMQCFHRRTTEIQALLQSTEPPLELQVVEPQVRKKLDELKELVTEAEDVYRQTVAAKRHVTDRMAECFDSLRNIHDSLRGLSGPDPAAVLSKLKDLCLQLQVQEEQVQSLVEDLQVLASVAGPDSLQSLCADGRQLQDKIQTVHQLFSEVEEETENNIHMYDRLLSENEHLKQWLNTAECKADKSLLQEEVHNQRVRTEAFAQILLLLRNTTFQQAVLIEESGKLLERYNNFETSVLGGPREKENRDRELNEPLSTQSCVRDVRQLDAPVSEICGIQRVLHATSAAEDRNVSLCVTENLDKLNHEGQEIIQTTEKQERDLLQSVQPCHNNQAVLECPSSSTFSQSLMLTLPTLNDDMREVSKQTQVCIMKDSPWLELETCLSLLKAQLKDVSCPREGLCNEEHFGQLLQDCCHKLTSLQEKLSACQAQKENTATPTSHVALEVLLQQLGYVEKDLSQLVTVMDPNTSLYQQVNNFLNHKRALDNSIREGLIQDERQTNQQVEKETVSAVSIDTDSSSLWSNFEQKLDCLENTESEPGVTQVKRQLQQWSQTQHSEPPSSSQLSPGLDEFISDHKESDIFCKSTPSAAPRETTALVSSCFSAASYWQPFHCHQNDSKTEIKGPFSTEEKHPYRFQPVTDTSGGTNVTADGPKQEPQTVSMQQAEALVTCSADSLRQIPQDNTIMKNPDSKTEILVTVPSCSHNSDSEELVITDSHKERNHSDGLASRHKLLRKPNIQTSDAPNTQSSGSCGPETECPTDAEGTTALDKQDAVADFCQTEGSTMSPVSTVEHEGLTNKKLSMDADDTECIEAYLEVMAEGENVDQENNVESKKQYLDSISRLFKEECEVEFPLSNEDTTVTQGQIIEDREPERTDRLDAVCGAAEMTGRSYKHKFTMQDILSGVQSFVESSTIINSTPRLDLNWFLKSSSSEAEIRLIRTVQRVLACRYQPAQLSITAMMRQLQDAENYSCCVQEQVAAIKGVGESEVCKSFEGQCSAALLDASSTVQVKAAQLDQVKRYHRQLKITKAFLEVIAAEQKKMSLNSLESSELQADQLRALLRTMDQKRGMIDELLKLSGQLSVHLSEAESSGALVAHLGDIQEEWRLSEGSIKRALQHASNSSSQLSALRQEAKRLKERLQTLLTSLQSLTIINNCKSTMDLLSWTADMKLCNQLYGRLHSQFDALVHFSLGQKEKDNIKNSLEELASLLNVTKMKLGTLNSCCGGVSSSKITKPLQDLIVWAKQAENHITIGVKLALFPEEARIQIAEMKKFQTDVFCWRSKIEDFQEIDASDKEEHVHVTKAIEELYETISNSLCHVLQTMKNSLKERETLLGQLAGMDAWLIEIHSKRDSFGHVESVSKADITNLEKELDIHKEATIEIESQLRLVETLGESCKQILIELSPGESRYLVNRLSGIWTELDGLLAHEKAISWELEELIHEWTTSEEELSSIETNLEQISTALKKQRFPLTQESITAIGLLKHMLTEHQCQVQVIQYCNESKRSSLLDSTGELQDKCNALSINAIEQDKYLQLKRQMEQSMDMVNQQVLRAKEKATSLGERFRLCQTLLVELPLVKTQCQEAADQLEAIAQELYPSELNTERQRIGHTVQTLVSCEHSITDDIKNLESKLLLGLHFESELPALMHLIQKSKLELDKTKPVDPDEKAIDVRLQKYWVLWRNMESGMRVLEALARKEKKNLRNYNKLHSLKNAAMQECHVQMGSVSQSRESLKDYQWAAQGAIGFLHNAEATFLSASGGFLDCTEEQKQTQQALKALEDGFQAHVDHLVKLVPQQPCLSRTKTEELHIQVLSQLLVGRAVLEAQAQLRLETLQRCAERQQRHRSVHEDVLQRLSVFEDRLSDCAAEHVTSYDKCVSQQERAKLLMEDLQRHAGNIEELRAGCWMQGCGAGKAGELGALWRRWASLRRGVGLLLAHTEQRAEEWKDITISMKQCRSSLASLQAEVPDSTANVSGEHPQELLAQTEVHQAGLEQEQQALASLEHRLEHALGLSHSQDPISPGPIGKTLLEIKADVSSLKERNQLVVAAAQAEEKERQHIKEELTELERHVLGLFAALEECSSQSQQQELKNELSSHKDKLKDIVDSIHSRYSEIPADICRHFHEVQLSLERAEERIINRSDHVRRLSGRVSELSLGLDQVKKLLKQRSRTVTEAQNSLKRVWDELDMWHSRLMLLESEVQDLAEDLPDQAHLLMDQLTEPLQCYQNAAQMVEHHTAFLSKIPACLQEFDDILYRATCWLDEAESWLGASCLFTTAKSLQNHATSLQVLLEDSQRIRHLLLEFRPVLADVSAVCDISNQEKQLEDTDRHVRVMQKSVVESLEHLLQAATAVEDLEAELKTIERNMSKIEAVLSSDSGGISLTEHRHNTEVFVSSAQSVKELLKDMLRCKEELNLPWGAEENLVVFSKATSLLQHLEDLEQDSVLENNIRKEETIPASNKPEDKMQESFVVTSSEEDDDEEDECCHSSSSDTLTSSVPEDPDETIRAADLQRMDAPLTNVQAVDGLSSELDTVLDTTESWLLSVRPWLDTTVSEEVETDFKTKKHGLESKAEAGSSLNPENVTAELLISTDLSTAEKHTCSSAAPDRHGSHRQETFVINTAPQLHQTTAGLEDTRLIPVRPITPFAAAAVFEEEEEHPSSSSTPSQDLLKDQDGISLIHLEQKSEESFHGQKELVSVNCQEDNGKEQPLWSQLSKQISQKQTSLNKLQQLQVQKSETVARGSTSAVLRQTQQATLMLREIVRSEGSGEHRDLFEALKRVLLGLDSLTDFLLTSVKAEEDHLELKLLQTECVKGELVTLIELLDKTQTVDNPDASQCVTCLQQSLHTVHDQLLSQMGLAQQQQVIFSNSLCFMDDLDLKQTEIKSEKVPYLKRCVLGRHLKESPGERARLQQASQSLLQGISRLVELGEECITEGQMHKVHNRSQLQAVLCGPKRLLQVLASQLAFAQHLFQHQPKALKCQEDEWVQLEVRAKALQQQALDRDVASQRRLQEWTAWEDNCGQLGRVLDECETFLSSEEPKGSVTEELLVQHRIDGCKQTLAQLDESRATLGLLLDQGNDLHCASVQQTGGALELQWRSVYKRTEQEMKRCKDMQENWASFQTDSASVTGWLLGANKQLQTWSDQAAASDLKQECVHSSLIKLLNFSVEVGSRSVQEASASRKASQLLRLREADCPSLRCQLTNMEAQWSQLTSELSKTQEQLQQHLLTGWPPDDLLSALEDWLKKTEAQLNVEKEGVKKAKNSSCFSEYLQHYKGLKAGLIHGQLLLDFLCQSGPQLVGADAQIVQCERPVLAERLGALRLRWLDLQGELENQINGAELMLHICAQRERKLQHLQNLTERQKMRLNQWKRPNSERLAHKALLEWEAHLERVKDMAVVVKELKDTHLNTEKEKEHTSDTCFSGEAEKLSNACEEMIGQMEILKPALQDTSEKWRCFKTHLKEFSLYVIRIHSSVQQLKAPVFSLEQAERLLHQLQELQLKADNGEELWEALDKSCQSLVDSVDPGAAQALSEQMEKERERWKGVLGDLEDELGNTQDTISMWRGFSDLFDSCSVQLRDVWGQWEKLLPLPQPHQDVQAQIHSVEELQITVESVKGNLAGVLAASKPLIGRLNPMVCDIVQSQTRQLSHDVLVLSQALEGQKKSLQEDLEQQNLLRVCLETLENQTKDTGQKLNASMDNVDSVKQLFQELCYLLSSLIDVSEMSNCVTLSNKEAERLHMLRGRYVESITRSFDLNMQLQSDHQLSLDFEQKCKALTNIQETLEKESTSRKPLSYSCFRQMSAVHQKLHSDIVIGHKLLHSLLCDAVQSTENTSEEKRSETLAQLSCIKQKWFDVVNVLDQRRALVKKQLRQCTTYKWGLKYLCNLLRDIDYLLPSTGPVICAQQQLRISTHDYECVEGALQTHSAVYTRTVEAGRALFESMTTPESHGLQTELQALEEAWDRALSLLGNQKAIINTTVQKWTQCQDSVTDIRSELDEYSLKLKHTGPEKPDDSETAKFLQETELSLQHLTGGLKELVRMKMDLSPFVAAGDSALLEQQLEQLHSQWEELCTKVSLRKQEIADRLNAWTIFNDKNKEFCDWLTQMENKVCHGGDLSFEEMVEKLKKDCMEEINLFSENKSHLKQLGEQLLLASDEAKQSQVHGSLQEVNQRWHNLFHHIEARVKKLKETLATVQQLDKNMSNLRSWLCRIEAELSRPITYSVCHHHEIQKRLAEHQELQRDIEQHTEGVASVLNLCDVLLRDEDAASGTEAEFDSLQETSHSLDQRWRTICVMAQDRRLRIEETWRLWCKFLEDYSRFEDWLKMAERTAANPNTADILYTVAKEELKKFEGFQRQVHERLTQLEIVNNQYRRLARENRTDRASQLKAMVHEGNRRWDTLHRRVATILRRLKYFTSQREEFEGTRDSMLVWLTELDLQLTNVEHFSESDVHQKIQQLNSFQKEITLNTERIDGLIVFGEGLIQKSSPQDAALIEEELEELHSYCQEVFGRLVRFHQRLSQPSITEEAEVSTSSFSLESSLGLMGRPWLGRGQGSFPATPTHLLTSPLSRSGRETPVSVDSLPLEWDHTGDVGGSSSHEDDEEDELDDEGAYFSAVSSRSVCDSPRWRTQEDSEPIVMDHAEAPPTLSSTPMKQGSYLHLMSQCSGSIEDFKRVSLILDDEESSEEFGLTGLSASDRQSGVIERWELLQAQSQTDLRDNSKAQLTFDLDNISSWLDTVIPDLERVQFSDPSSGVEDMTARAKELREMHKMFSRYKSTVLSVNLSAQGDPELQQKLTEVNQRWSRACTSLQQWDSTLRNTLMLCQEFHETLHSLLLWLAHAESTRYAVDINHSETPVKALRQHRNTLTDLQEELLRRQTQQASLHALWSQLQPDHTEDSDEAREKLHVTGSKMKILLREVTEDLRTIQQRLGREPASDEQNQRASTVSSEAVAKKSSPNLRERSQPRSFFYRLLRAAFPLHVLLLLLLLIPCLVPQSEHSCSVANNFARSFYPMLHYTNGPPPT